VGYGDIGYYIANAVKAALGMRIIALKRDVSKIDEERKMCIDELVDYTGFEQLCKESDYIISILPYTPETVNIFDKKAFSNMKPNCCFMNFGRGESVVEQDLVEALNSKIIEAAVLDVFAPEPLPKESKFWAMENVFITPHSGVAADNIIDHACDCWVEHFSCWKDGKPLRNVVDVKQGY
jgi:phosphoglycerate dehydrogenase-like enzyme